LPSGTAAFLQNAEKEHHISINQFFVMYFFVV
jgi:hypothetical protein